MLFEAFLFKLKFNLNLILASTILQVGPQSLLEILCTKDQNENLHLELECGPAQSYLFIGLLGPGLRLNKILAH